MSWEERKLGDFCEVIAGQSPEGKYYNDMGEGVPFYQGKKMFGLKYIGNPTKWTKKVTKKACSGDILMSVRAPVGPINFTTQNICIGRGLAAIRASDKLDKEFLFYYLLSKQDEIKGNEGAVFASINKSQIEQLSFLYVGINEQKRIVAILDLAFAEIEKARDYAEQNLKNVRELFESYLNSRLFDIGSKKPEQTLSCVTELIVDCEHKTAPTQSEGFPSIRTPNIGKGKLLLDGVRRVSEETYKIWTKRAVPQYGDLILAREAPAGNVGVIPKGEKVCLGQRTVLIRPNVETVNSKYLAFLLLHPIMQERLLSHSTGSTVQHVNMKDIRKLSISNLPSMSEQLDDVNVLEETKIKVAQLERIYSRKLQALDELKKSILQKAFTGKLTN